MALFVGGEEGRLQRHQLPQPVEQLPPLAVNLG